MVKEIRETPEGEIEFIEINPVRRREGVETEEFERMTGFPFRAQEQQRAIKQRQDIVEQVTEDSDIADNKYTPIEDIDLQELSLLAFQGREALESIGGEAVNNERLDDIVDHFNGEYITPYDKIDRELSRATDVGDGYEFLYMEYGEFDGEAFGNTEFENVFHLEDTVTRISEFVNDVIEYGVEDYRDLQGADTETYQNLREEAYNVERFTQELQNEFLEE